MDLDERLSLYFLARLILWRDRLDAMDVAAEKQLEAALRQARTEVAERLEAGAAGLVAITAWTHDRLETVGRYLDDMLAATRKDVAGMIAHASALAAENSLGEYNDMLSLGGRASRVGHVDMSPAQIRAWFEVTPLGGQALASWVDGAFSAGVRSSILTTLQSGGLQGKGTPGMVRDALLAAWDQGEALTRRDAITVARTYTQTANVNAMTSVYEANSDIVDGWQWCATLEPGYKQTGRGTCLCCAALDGQVFKLHQGPPCPLHARCRCVRLPKLKTWRDLGMDFDEVEAVTRPYTVRPDKNIDQGGRRAILEVGFHQGSYGTWLAKQSKAMQRDIMGPERFALYASGRVHLEDFVDSSGRLRSLEALAG